MTNSKQHLQRRSILYAAVQDAQDGLERNEHLYASIESETEIIEARLKQLKKMARRLQRKTDKVDNKVEDHRMKRLSEKMKKYLFL